MEKLFHVSENGNIKTFHPRPSPSLFEGLNNDVVFAINEILLHNYLLPRDCPRVCYYATPKTTLTDKEKFMGINPVDFIINIEQDWLERIKQTTLYCYELPTPSFKLLDANAGYYVSYKAVEPIVISIITNPFEALLKRTNVEIKILPTLLTLAEQVSKSSLGFSLIRMRNAKKDNQ